MPHHTTLNHITIHVATLMQTLKTERDMSHVGSPQVPFLMCTLEIPQKLQYKFFALNFCYLYFRAFSQTMSFSCIFVFAPSFIRMDLSIVTSSTSLTFPEFPVLFLSISLLFSFIESHFALSSARWHL